MSSEALLVLTGPRLPVCKKGEGWATQTLKVPSAQSSVTERGSEVRLQQLSSQRLAAAVAFCLTGLLSGPPPVPGTTGSLPGPSCPPCLLPTLSPELPQPWRG